MQNYVNRMLNNNQNRPRLGLGLGPRDRTYRGYTPNLNGISPAQIKTFIEELLDKIDDVQQAQGKIDIVLKNGTKHIINLSYR